MTGILRNEFARLLRDCGLAKPTKVAVALSGGPDSLALTLLTKEWSESRDKQNPSSDTPSVVAMTCDHHARPESLQEAECVRGWVQQRGIQHRIISISWPEGFVSPVQKFEEHARKLRYESMIDACKSEGIDTLLVGHHLNDQVETFLLRFARSSGIDGLASIRQKSIVNKITIIRPLLPILKTRLLETCRRFNQEYVRDPMNASLDFDRNRVRAALNNMLSGDDKSVQRIQNIVRLMQDARVTISKMVNDEMKAIVYIPNNFGCCFVDIQKLVQLPDRISSRVVIRCLSLVHNARHPPRASSIDVFVAWAKDLVGGKANGVATRTLSNCLITLQNPPSTNKPARKINAEHKSVSGGITHLMFAPEQNLHKSLRHTYHTHGAPISLDGPAVLWEERLQIRVWRTEPVVKVLHNAGVPKEFYLRRLQPKDIERNNRHGLTSASTFHWGATPVPREVLFSLPVLVDSSDQIMFVPHFQRTRLKCPLRGVAVEIAQPLVESHFMRESIDDDTGDGDFDSHYDQDG